MLAKYLLICLLAEAFAVGFAAWHWAAGQPSLALFVWIGLLLIAWLAGGLAVTLATYIIARFSVPRSSAIAWPTLGTLLAEALAATLLFVVLQPFARWLVPPLTRSRSHGRRTRVLFIHGYLCNSGLWWFHRKALHARGFDCMTLDLEPPWGSIDQFAGQVRRQLETMQSENPDGAIVLIAHSMGGLVARAALNGADAHNIALVTLGSPHRGTVLAHWGLGQCARQMRPGGPWLNALDQAGRSQVPLVSLWSEHDNFMAPADTPLITGCRNVALRGLGHLSLALSVDVQQHLIDEAEAADKALPFSSPRV